jgi:hypothetical protein
VDFGGFAALCDTSVTTDTATNILISLDRKSNHNEPISVTTIVSSYVKFAQL